MAAPATTRRLAGQRAAVKVTRTRDDLLRVVDDLKQEGANQKALSLDAIIARLDIWIGRNR